MSKFLTEKETEDRLVNETRMLTLPNQKRVPVTNFKLFWNVFDLLQSTGMFTEQRLIQLAFDWSERDGVPFDKALEGICGYAQSQARKMF